MSNQTNSNDWAGLCSAINGRPRATTSSCISSLINFAFAPVHLNLQLAICGWIIGYFLYSNLPCPIGTTTHPRHPSPLASQPITPSNPNPCRLPILSAPSNPPLEATDPLVVRHPRLVMVHLYAVVGPTTLLLIGDRLKIPMNVAAVLAAPTNHHHVDPHLMEHLPEVVDIPRTHPV